MSFSIDIKNIFPYTLEDLDSFSVYMYEWIDNLNFTIAPEHCLDNYLEYQEIVKSKFIEAGWDGNGEIEFMWLPPFTLPDNIRHEATMGITIYHVKQTEDGLSFLLSPIPLDFYDAFKTSITE